MTIPGLGKMRTTVFMIFGLLLGLFLFNVEDNTYNQSDIDKTKERIKLASKTR